jgi:hypothetical protein
VIEGIVLQNLQQQLLNDKSMKDLQVVSIDIRDSYTGKTINYKAQERAENCAMCVLFCCLPVPFLVASAFDYRRNGRLYDVEIEMRSKTYP